MNSTSTKEMYGMYRKIRNLRETAAVFGVTKDTLRHRFFNSGLPLTIPDFPEIIHEGEHFVVTTWLYHSENDPRRFLHHVVWEEANGPLKQGEHVQFIDKNCANLELTNLYIVPRILRIKESV